MLLIVKKCLSSRERPQVEWWSKLSKRPFMLQFAICCSLFCSEETALLFSRFLAGSRLGQAWVKWWNASVLNWSLWSENWNGNGDGRGNSKRRGSRQTNIQIGRERERTRKNGSETESLLNSTAWYLLCDDSKTRGEEERREEKGREADRRELDGSSWTAFTRAMFGVRRLHCLPCSNCNTESDSRFVSDSFMDSGQELVRARNKLLLRNREPQMANGRLRYQLPSESWLCFCVWHLSFALFVWQSQLRERERDEMRWDERAKEAPEARNSAEGDAAATEAAESAVAVLPFQRWIMVPWIKHNRNQDENNNLILII